MQIRSAVVSLVIVLAPTLATADPPLRGTGTGGSASTAPVTKSGETPSENARLPARDLPVEPRHGLLGAPGAAVDQAGPSRLGRHGERAERSSYGESATVAIPEIPDTWRSGDRARSPSSADVRAARQQQAPDLEWAGSGAPPGPPQKQPQEPYGIQYQQRPRSPKP